MTITTDNEFDAGWAMHQCPEIVRLREYDDQMAEVIIPPLLVCCTVMRATEIIEDKVIEVADRLIKSASEPHCSAHQLFDIDCIECSDALERQREDDEGRCTDPAGHDWQVSDTDRTYCTNCGADGDG